MNSKQKSAIQLAMNGHNLFLTGTIGTGKSKAIETIVRTLQDKDTKVAVTASTGLASKQISGCKATTLHHWAGLRDNRYTNDQLLQLIMRDVSFKSTKQNIQSVDTLIIDEISMISADVFSQLEFICRNVRNNDKVFGGIHVIVVGDFQQLKPVPNPQYYDPGEYCFKSAAWKLAINHVIVLEEIMRQHNLDLIMIIQELAAGNVSGRASEIIAKLSRPLPPGPEPVYLFSRNFDVEMANYDSLLALPGAERLYKSQDTGPKEYCRKFQVPKHLVLKEHCKVMLVTNLNPVLVNGTLGIVRRLCEDTCIVDFEGIGPTSLKPFQFSFFSRAHNRDIATRKQLPIKLAYAITIHKAQGMTIPRLVVNAKHAFQPGQLATAIGRATELDGLQVLNYDQKSVLPQPESVIKISSQAIMHPTALDYTCCKNKDFKDGNENESQELAVNSPTAGDDSESSDDDDYDMDNGDDDDGDDGNDEDTTEVETVMDNLEFLEQVDSVQFRRDVQHTFTEGETPSKKTLCQKDSDISEEKLHSYLNILWRVFGRYFRPIEETQRTKTHKDFSTFIIKADRYFLSQMHDEKLKQLFSRHPDESDRRLAHKYHHSLLNRFLATRMVQSLDIEETDSHSQAAPTTISPAATAGMRYLSGMCIAKTPFKQCNIALNHLYTNQVKVADARRKIMLLDLHIVTQENIIKTSTIPDSLALTIQKQNLRNGLTHISDSMFSFFCLLDSRISSLLTNTQFSIHKSNLFAFIQRTVLADRHVTDAWVKLFCTESEEEPSYLIALMEKIVLPYLHVKFNQFRKDRIGELRDVKTLEIRKAVWTAKSGKRTSDIPDRASKRKHNKQY